MTSITEVHPRSEEVHIMPYAPDVFVEGAAGFLFLAGATASPLYHQHPHVPEEHVLSTDVTRRTFANIKMVLGAESLTWCHVVTLTKHLTDIREMDNMYAVLDEHFTGWHLAGTLPAVNYPSEPGARIELDMIVPSAAGKPGAFMRRGMNDFR
jgi:enamine deaminase RidA (YjgF/YER057c/UK114 family)